MMYIYNYFQLGKWNKCYRSENLVHQIIRAKFIIDKFEIMNFNPALATPK